MHLFVAKEGVSPFFWRDKQEESKRYNKLNEAEAARSDNEFNLMRIRVNFSAEYSLKFEGPRRKVQVEQN